jgi:hypothetical protein
MAVLQKQEAEIPLNGGMDTKQGAELQSVNTLRLVEDLRWNAAGELEKRPAVASTVTIATPGAVGVYADLTGAGVVESRGEVYAITGGYGAMNESGEYLGTGGLGVGSGAYPYPLNLAPKACRVSRLTIDRVSGSESDHGFRAAASAPYGSSTLVTAGVIYEENGNGCVLRLQAINIETGAVVAQLQTDTDVGSSNVWSVDACEISGGANPGVVITFASGSGATITIAVYRYRPSTKDFVNDTAIGTTAANVRHRIKASATAGNFYCAFEASAGNLYVGEYAAGASTTLQTSHTGLHAATGGVDLVLSGSKVMIASASSGLAGSIYAERYGTPATYITLSTLSAVRQVRSVTAARETASSNADRAVVFATVNTDPAGTLPAYDRLDCAQVDFSATTCAAVSSISTSYNHCAAIGWAVTHGDRAYVLASGSEGVDTTSGMWLRAYQLYSGVTTRARPIARVAHDVLADLFSGSTTNLFSTFVAGDKVYASLLTDYSPDAMPGPGVPVPQTVSLSCVDLAARPLSYAHKDGVATVAGGLLFDIDGESTVMSQAHCRPKIMLDTSVAGTTSTVTGVSIVAVARWIDAAGREHRSAPSEAVSTGVITNKRIDVYAYELPFSPWPDFSAGRYYSIDLYVTEDGEPDYYLANTVNNKATSYAGGSGMRVFTDVSIGSATNPPLYSTGDGDDELVSEPPPSFIAICTVGDRMFAVDAEDRSRVWFTKPFVAGYAPEWNTANTLTIGDRGVGVSDVNGIPTVFAERGIWQIYGEGPNAAGVGSFAPARRLPHEVECLDGLSVCKTGAGVFFRGRRGIYLLDTGLALQPVGLSIDPNLAVSGTPTGYCRIVYDELANEVHVLDFDQAHYVYNLLEGKWATRTNDVLDQHWLDACVVRGRVYTLHNGSANTDAIKRIYATDEAGYNLDTATWDIETPWARFDGATGEMRVWEVIVQIRVGTSQDGVCGGNVQVEYETRDGETDTFSFTGTEIEALKTAAGGEGATVNLRCQISKQRTRQFRLSISAGNPDYAYEGHVPIAARVLFGITPRGSRKSPATQSKGSFVPS